MGIIALGINHKTAPVAVREKVSFDPATMPDVLQQVLRSLSPVTEVSILSTCNRTEIYCSYDNECEGADKLTGQALISWLSKHHGVDEQVLHDSSYIYHNTDAVQHMMRVASGLDSLVLGEPQILGQFKSAFAVSQQAGTTGSNLGRLFRQTFTVAKEVRTNTAIGQNPVSVAFAAVSMAKHIFSDLGQSTALLIGAGETIDLVAKHLKDAGIKQIIVANRTLARAQKLAEQFHAEAVLLEDIAQELPRADIVISSTASPLPILGKGTVERALKKRRHAPIFMVDIAVPRDIEQEVGDLNDVFLYTVDDLKDIIEENVKSRQDAAVQAEQLIVSGVERFMRELRSLDVVSMVTSLRGHVESLRDECLIKARKQLANGDDPAKVLQQFAHIYTNKILHTPTKQMRQAGAEGQLEVMDWVQELFQLSSSTENDTSETETAEKNKAT
ncbi:MAG: glutamyl-tRNA reductase [Oleispira sp.]|nr:glutamyl-tRNA reductase [Oleispira sp.]MBL4881031.1 glutamyl-tRNA reductase [Oleispira sp.]